MAKKPDLSAVKNFLFNYGEKVALGVCGLVAALLLVMGFMGTGSAGNAPNGKPWAIAINGGVQTIEGQINNASVEEMTEAEKKAIDPQYYRWLQELSAFIPGPFISLAEVADTKRRNPTILALKTEPDTMQLDYLRGLVFRYDNEPAFKRSHVFKEDKGGAAGVPGAPPVGMKPPMAGGIEGGAAGNLMGAADAAAAGLIVKDARARRMVVVHMTFPMAEQVEAYVKALRLESQAELFALRDSLPRPVGLNVVRYEVLGEGKFNPAPVQLYVNLPKKGLVVEKTIDEAMREGLYDDEQNTLYENYLFAGMATPLHQLANATYPPLHLHGIQAAAVAAADPKQGEVGGPKKGVGIPKVPGGIPGLPGGIPGMQKPGGPKMGGMMGGEAGGNVAAARETEVKPWSLLVKQNAVLKPLIERFEGGYNVFHPTGTVVKEDKKNVAAGPGLGNPPGVMMPGPAGAMNGAAGAGGSFNPFDRFGGAAGNLGGGGPIMPPGGKGGPLAPPGGEAGPMGALAQPGANVKWDTDALVRFIDLDVVPGKTYRYYVQVRFANPNFERKNDVAFVALSEIKELLSPWTLTGEISIPGEYQFYAVDQVQQDIPQGIKPNKNAFAFNPREQTALQIHRWFEKGEDRNLNQKVYPIGDWAIAERLLVRRGEYIGHADIPAKVAVWDKTMATFRTTETIAADGKRKGGGVSREGIPLDFQESIPGPLLVDFEGGRQGQRVGASNILDESAVDALILMPDGRLVVHNSRHDSDEANDIGKLRAERVEQVRTRFREAQAAGEANAAAPMGPGGGIPGLR